MEQDAPQTISVCIQRTQLTRLDALAALCRSRGEYSSRSAIARKALNRGLDALLSEEADEDSDDSAVPDGGSTAAIAMGMTQ